MLREVRRLDAPELEASHRAVEVRSPMLRVSVHRAENVTSDYGLVDRALPFVGLMSRPSLTVLLEGRGRFDEAGRRAEVNAGDLALSDASQAGTEAYSGARSVCLVMMWDAHAIGAPISGRVEIGRLAAADRARIASAASAIEGPRPEAACLEILRVLRAVGLPFERLAPGDLGPPASAHDQALATALGKQLSNLEAHPAIEDLTQTLGWGPRRVHRWFAAAARRYALPWDHWRSLLHHVRMTSALRLLSAPGATTERVARLTGFRAPTALCHAFAKADLPSPGTLARSSRGSALDAWAAHTASPRAP